MKKKKKKKTRTKWKYESWLALYPTNYTFNILYLSVFLHRLVHSLSFFFSLLFSHPHMCSHTPRFPLFSFLNFLSSLSFYVVLLLLLLFSSVFIFFNLPITSAAVLHLIWLFSTSHSSFSLFHSGFFVLLYFFCKVHLFISFLFSSIYLFIFGWDFSFIVQTPYRPNFEFRLVFIEGFLIERVRRGFLVWENDPIPKSKVTTR